MSNAPIELSQIGLDPQAFKFSDHKSWRGPCPSCGGHRRFVIYINGEWPLWFGACDECGTEIRAWEKVKTKYDPQKAAAIAAERIREQNERDEYRRKKLAEFSTGELWKELSDRMTTPHIEWWEKQGVPEDIQRFLRIGFKADKIYMDGDKLERHSPAYTIPWFGQNFEFKTLQYRLINPFNPDDRYRFEYGLPGGGTHYFMADPSVPIGDKVIICEGAKKAIITWLWLCPQDEHFTVIAASSNNTLKPALDATRECGKRLLVLDPGSEKKMYEAEKNNQNLQAVYLPGKIDDMYREYGLDRTAFENVLRAI